MLLLMIFLLFLCAFIVPANCAPKFSSTYFVKNGSEDVRLIRVQVNQFEAEKFDMVTFECPRDASFVELQKGKSLFRLHWHNCPIKPGVDTLEMVIFYARAGEPQDAEHKFVVQYRNQEMILDEYRIDLGLLRGDKAEVEEEQQDMEDVLDTPVTGNGVDSTFVSAQNGQLFARNESPKDAEQIVAKEVPMPSGPISGTKPKELAPMAVKSIPEGVAKLEEKLLPKVEEESKKTVPEAHIHQQPKTDFGMTSAIIPIKVVDQQQPTTAKSANFH